MPELTKKEEILMLTIWRLREEAYGVRIKKHIRDVTGKEWNYGTLYAMLDQLVKKRMLDRNEGKPMPERGGRRKVFYSITSLGIQSLQDALELQKAIWGGVNKMALENGR